MLWVLFLQTSLIKIFSVCDGVKKKKKHLAQLFYRNSWLIYYGTDMKYSKKILLSGGGGFAEQIMDNDLKNN